MFRKVVGYAKNIVKNINQEITNDLYEKQIIGFAIIGMTGGIYLGAQETRRYSDTKFTEHISNISLGGTVGAVCGSLFGMASPFLIPVGTICGLASLGMYGYNKINPVIPWHQQEDYKNYKAEQIIDNEGFMHDIIKNKKTN